MRPTRPINIKIMIITLPIIERSDVMPSDIPQVPNADDISNNNATTGTPGSVKSKINNAVITIIEANKMTA